MWNHFPQCAFSMNLWKSPHMFRTLLNCVIIKSCRLCKLCFRCLSPRTCQYFSIRWKSNTVKGSKWMLEYLLYNANILIALFLNPLLSKRPCALDPANNVYTAEVNPQFSWPLQWQQCRKTSLWGNWWKTPHAKPSLKKIPNHCVLGWKNIQSCHFLLNKLVMMNDPKFPIAQ